VLYVVAEKEGAYVGEEFVPYPMFEKFIKDRARVFAPITSSFSAPTKRVMAMSHQLSWHCIQQRTRLGLSLPKLFLLARDDQ
jgi:hypothetical protein